jgi:hypothetical protein
VENPFMDSKYSTFHKCHHPEGMSNEQLKGLAVVTEEYYLLGYNVM